MSFALWGNVHERLYPWRHLAVVCVTIAMVALAALSAAGIGLRSIDRSAEYSPDQTPPPAVRIAPVTDPTNLRRLELADLVYEGAFRLPPTDEGDSFSFGGRPLAYNPEHNSLFVGTHSKKIAEVSIPQPAQGPGIASLPFARYLQPFSDPTEGRITEVADDGTALGGLLVHAGQLFGSGYIHYDANNTQTVSHFVRPLDLSQRVASKLVRVWQNGKSGFVAGYMASVPPEWQSRLGGPAVTGQCCLSIVMRTSHGPAAFAFDPADVEGGKTAAAHPLLYYPHDHPTLGKWEATNPTYGATTQVGGVALINGTRTALFVGRNGLGEFCYGGGTSDESLKGKRGADGETQCFDPSSSDKGQHAYPYRYQFWAYDLGELAEVRAGKRDPWEVKPYAVWPFELPFPEPGVRVGGVAYDASRQRLFVAQLQADRDGYAHRPLIHVFRVQ
jgi:hypothetical protein